MTLTLDISTALFWLGLSTAVVAYIVIGAGNWLLRSGKLIETAPFISGLRRLILANNIDRAIKLCNVVETPLTSACKALLTRANRGGEELSRAYDVALLRLAADLPDRRRGVFLDHVLPIISSFAPVLLLWFAADWWLEYAAAVIVYLPGRFITAGYVTNTWTEFRKHRLEAEAAIAEVYALLQSRRRASA